MKSMWAKFKNKKNKDKQEVKDKLKNKAPAVGATPEGSINTYNREQWKQILSTMGKPEISGSPKEKIKDFDREVRVDLRKELLNDYGAIELFDPEDPNDPVNDPIPTFIENRGYQFKDESETDQSELECFNGSVIENSEAQKSLDFKK